MKTRHLLTLAAILDMVLGTAYAQTARTAPANPLYYAAKMQKIVFPLLYLQNASFDEAIAFLRTKSKELDTFTSDPDLKGVNIVLSPNTPAPTSRISLDLKNVPMSEALRYIAELSSMGYFVEPDAVVLMTRQDAVARASKEFELKDRRMQTPMVFSLQGYELARKDAATLLQAQGPALDARTLLAQTATLARQGRAKIARFPTITTSSGQRQSAVENDMRIELDPVLGPDGVTVDLNMSVSRADRNLNVSLATCIDGYFLIGSLEGRDSNTVELVFLRVDRK